MHVLVVEDDAHVRRMLRFVLEDLGTVTAVGTREAAMRAVTQQRPDVVVLDVMLHGSSGLALLSHWRADEELADLPVVLLTALDDSMERKAGRAAGANAYLTKPFANEELVAVVAALGGQAHAGAALEGLQSGHGVLTDAIWHTAHGGRTREHAM